MASGEWQIAKQTEPPDVECSTNSACLAVELFSCLAVELSSCATKGRHGKELPLAHAQSKGWGVCMCVWHGEGGGRGGVCLVVCSGYGHLALPQISIFQANHT